MRAIFREYSNSLKDGSYVFVAKVGLFESSYEKLQKDFLKVIKQSKTLKVVS